MTLRDRLTAAAKIRVRAWVDGPDALSEGDPRRRIVADPTSDARITLLQYGEDDGDPVTVGKYCALHQRAAVFHGGNHRLDWVGVLNATWDGDTLVKADGAPTSRGPVVIGSDVYVGYDALIMSGVTIGDGAVVSARAWVTRNVEPYEIVAGNPARHVGWRFDEPTRAALMRIRWWDWPRENVTARSAEINSADVAGFVARHDPGPEVET